MLLLAVLAAVTALSSELPFVFLSPLRLSPLQLAYLAPLILSLWASRSHISTHAGSRVAVMDGVIASSILKVVILLVQVVQRMPSLETDVRAAEQVLSLRSIHLAVLFGICPCGRSARQLYDRHMTLVLVLQSAIYAPVLGKSIALLMLRGPALFAAVTHVTHMLANTAIKSITAREVTMGELRIALDAFGSRPGAISGLVKPSAITREWNEGPLTRLCAGCMVVCMVMFLTIKLLWGSIAVPQPNVRVPVQFFSSNVTMLMTLSGFPGMYVMWRFRNTRLPLHAVRTLSVLVSVMNVVHITERVKELAAFRASHLVGGECVMAQAWGTVAEPGSPLHGVCCEPASPHRLVAVHAAVDAVESFMAFVRGILVALFPVQSEVRVLSLVLVVLKQLLGSISRSIILDEQEAVIGALVRDTSMVLLGIAVVSAS